MIMGENSQAQLPTYGQLWDYMQSDGGIEKLLTLEQNLQHVNVRESTLPGTGQGLFTTKNFRKNEIVGYYWGRILSCDQVKILYPDDGSLSDSGRLLNMEGVAMASQRHAEITVDASRSCVAIYCQHQPQNAANTIFREVLDSPYRLEWLRMVKNSPNDAITDYRMIELVASKSIKSGMECFVDYGEGYFREGEEIVLLDDDNNNSDPDYF